MDSGSKKIFPFVARKAFSVWVGIFCLFSPIATLATNNPLMELPFEDLMQLKVSTVSKLLQKVELAPGIVSVLTAAEIRKFGARKLSDALALMPGVLVAESYFGQAPALSIRSNLGGEPFNSKILLLINGHPRYDSVFSSFNVDTIPLESIKQIELVRGPASVIYGSNALTGVINIITHKAGDRLSHSALSVQSSSDNAFEGSATISENLGALEFFLSATTLNEHGYERELSPNQDEAGVGADLLQALNGEGFYGNFSVTHYSLDLQYWKGERSGGIGLIPNTRYSIENHDTENVYVDFQYQNRLFELSNFEIRLRYDYDKSVYTIDNFGELQNQIFSTTLPNIQGDATSESKKLGFESVVHYHELPSTLISIGLSYDHHFDVIYKSEHPTLPEVIPDLAPWIGSRDNEDAAAFINTQYRLNEALSLIAGTRYGRNKVTGDHWSYRAGAIYSITPTLSVKALMATSYRSPSFLQLYVDAPPILSGSTDLEPEELRGFDLQLSYFSGSNFKGSLTYFQNETVDFIVRQNQANGITYANASGTEIRGIEYEFRMEPTKTLNFFSNGTLIIHDEDNNINPKAITQTESDDLLIVRRWLNAGVTVKNSNQSLHASLNTRYVGQWGEADSYNISNLTLRYFPLITIDASDVRNTQNDLELSLSFNNLFNQDYDYAEWSRRNVDTIDGGPGRAVIARIRTTF